MSKVLTIVTMLFITALYPCEVSTAPPGCASVGCTLGSPSCVSLLPRGKGRQLARAEREGLESFTLLLNMEAGSKLVSDAWHEGMSHPHCDNVLRLLLTC